MYTFPERPTTLKQLNLFEIWKQVVILSCEVTHQDSVQKQY